jgi:hypothetical protein
MSHASLTVAEKDHRGCSSTVAPIDNLQNLVIAVTSGISFGFLPIRHLTGPDRWRAHQQSNTCILLCYYWRYLSVEKQRDLEAAGRELVVTDNEVSSHRCPLHTGQDVACLVCRSSMGGY